MRLGLAEIHDQAAQATVSFMLPLKVIRSIISFWKTFVVRVRSFVMRPFPALARPFAAQVSDSLFVQVDGDSVFDAADAVASPSEAWCSQIGLPTST